LCEFLAFEVVRMKSRSMVSQKRNGFLSLLIGIAFSSAFGETIAPQGESYRNHG
jgi:hypothetical protein